MRCQRFKPRGKVHAVTVEIVAIDDQVADVETDAEPDVAVLGDALIAFGHPALDFDGTARGGQDRSELHQKPVAHHLEDAPPCLAMVGSKNSRRCRFSAAIVRSSFASIRRE